MKAVAFTPTAAKMLRKLSRDAARDLVAKVERYAETGAGDVRALSGRPGLRLRSGDYRALFVETETAVTVLAVGHRRDVYE